MNNKESYRYDSVTVAKLIVAEANSRHLAVNMTKIQKLLYVAYGLFLAVDGSRLTNEHPQAWPYGPVFPTTRNKLLKADLYTITLSDESLTEIAGDEYITSLMNLVFRSFGTWSASQLTAWSHGEGTPWERTVESNDFRWGAQIPDDFIQSYFRSIIRNERQ